DPFGLVGLVDDVHGGAGHPVDLAEGGAESVGDVADDLAGGVDNVPADRVWHGVGHIGGDVADETGETAAVMAPRRFVTGGLQAVLFAGGGVTELLLLDVERLVGQVGGGLGVGGVGVGGQGALGGVAGTG